jgi:hypothetical protein
MGETGCGIPASICTYIGTDRRMSGLVIQASALLLHYMVAVRTPAICAVLPPTNRWLWSVSSVTSSWAGTRWDSCDFRPATPQEISRWLSTVVARIRGITTSYEICGRHGDTGAGFLQVLRLRLPFIPSTAPHSSSSLSSFGPGTNKQTNKLRGL